MARAHLLTIGEFSRLSRISVRMLRHDDEHGVLRAVLAHQRGRLLDESAAVTERIRELDHLITQRQEPAMTAITRRTLPARTVASVRGTIPTYADEGLLWQRLMAGLPAAGARVAPNALATAVFHDEDHVEQDADVEVRLDVVAPFTGTDDVACVDVPAVEVVVGTLHGTYDGIGEVMEAIGGWIGTQGHTVAGPMFNVYVVGPEVSHDPSDWVTDVCVPVTD